MFDEISKGCAQSEGVMAHKNERVCYVCMFDEISRDYPPSEYVMAHMSEGVMAYTRVCVCVRRHHVGFCME